MRSWIKVLSLSAALALAGCKTTEEATQTRPKTPAAHIVKQTKHVTYTSGTCAWIKENVVVAKKTDDQETKRRSANQIDWYNKHC